jgi:hypothetical protein
MKFAQVDLLRFPFQLVAPRKVAGGRRDGERIPQGRVEPGVSRCERWRHWCRALPRRAPSASAARSRTSPRRMAWRPSRRRRLARWLLHEFDDQLLLHAIDHVSLDELVALLEQVGDAAMIARRSDGVVASPGRPRRPRSDGTHTITAGRPSPR